MVVSGSACRYWGNTPVKPDLIMHSRLIDNTRHEHRCVFSQEFLVGVTEASAIDITTVVEILKERQCIYEDWFVNAGSGDLFIYYVAAFGHDVVHEATGESGLNLNGITGGK